MIEPLLDCPSLSRPLGRGQVVRRLTLDQVNLGSNPSAPAIILLTTPLARYPCDRVRIVRAMTRVIPSAMTAAKNVNW